MVEVWLVCAWPAAYHRIAYLCSDGARDFRDQTVSAWLSPLLSITGFVRRAGSNASAGLGDFCRTV